MTMTWTDLPLKGETLISVKLLGDEVIFRTATKSYRMFHYQECCEDVRMESVVGDLNDLVGVPLLCAEEAHHQAETTAVDSTTWTFYKFATIKGFVDIRWVGSSNGYYSESVSLEEQR